MKTVSLEMGNSDSCYSANRSVFFSADESLYKSRYECVSQHATPEMGSFLTFGLVLFLMVFMHVKKLTFFLNIKTYFALKGILKGKVDPKMNILTYFTHSQVVTNLYEFFFFCLTQNKIFWRMLVTKQLTLAIDFIVFLFHTIAINGYHQLFGYQ